MRGIFNAERRATKVLAVAIILSIISGCAQQGQNSAAQLLQEQTLKLATTTSTCDTGLLNELNKLFYEQRKVKVQVACMGTGASIRTGEQGEADVVMAHAPALEEASIANGFFVNRRYLMYNEFVIIGPETDPAGTKGAKSAAEAFKKIAAAGAPFFSRGDGSGTHVRELELWREAGIEPKGEWYKSVGKGMGATITMVTAQQGYTLADRGTYLAVKSSTDLKILVEGDKALFNPYHVMAVNPERYPDGKYELAMHYIAFLTSLQGQKIILNYGKYYALDPNTGAKKSGFRQALFVPAAISKEVLERE